MKKILLLLMFVFLLVGTVSALNFDNVKSYDSSSKTVTIKNAFGLPLIGDDLMKAQLITPSIYQVPTGYQKIAEFNLSSYTDYTNILGNFEFYDLKTGTQVLKNLDVKYLVDNYTVVKTSICDNDSKICSFESKLEHNMVWIPWNQNITKNDNITIGLFVNVLPNEKIEWIPTIAGVKVNEWAVYTSDATITYYLDGSDNYTIVTYTNNGTFNITDAVLDVSFLVVGGGGAGGYGYYGGGGGAGGFIYNVTDTLPAGNYSVKVGQGGDPSPNDAIQGGNGQNSSFNWINGTPMIQASGGGGGGSRGAGVITGANGSSGGGGSQRGSGADGGWWIDGQGRAGGNTTNSGSNRASSGGGGRSQAGGAGDDVTGGYGGNGSSVTLNGTAVYYAGGGGGATDTGSGGTNGAGGLGGGGAGGGTGSNALNGTGGGGGGSGDVQPGGYGGSGIVILKFLNYTSVSSSLNVSLATPNYSNFTGNAYLAGYVNTFPNDTFISIANVSLIINGSINSTNTSGTEGLYNFTIPLGAGLYYWTLQAYGNDSSLYSASNGTYQFNKSLAPLQQIKNFTNITAGFNEGNFPFDDLYTYFDGASFYPNGTQGISYINFTFKNPDTGILTNLTTYFNYGGSSNRSYIDKFLTSDLLLESQGFWNAGYTFPLNFGYGTGYKNMSIDITPTACNIYGSCVKGNTFNLHVVGYTTSNNPSNIFTQGSNWLANAFPDDASEISLFQRLGFVVVAMLVISLFAIFGLMIGGVEFPVPIYVAGVADVLLMMYFISIGYISIWLVIFLVLLGMGIKFLFSNNG